MYKIVLIVCAFTLFACGHKTGNNASKTALPQKSTSIRFEEKMHSFGKLTAGEIVLFTFVFTNTGDTDYWINNLHSDCGCVTTSYAKELVKPGQTGKIEVELDTSGLVGKEFKTIEVNGNSKELKHLAIFAEVNNEILDIKY